MPDTIELTLQELRRLEAEGCLYDDGANIRMLRHPYAFIIILD